MKGEVMMLGGIHWSYMLVHLFVIWLIVLITVLIRRKNLNSTNKHYITIAAIIIVFLTVLHFLGYQISFIFRLIEWSTKFILPWIALYWLTRAIKLLEKKIK